MSRAHTNREAAGELRFHIAELVADLARLRVECALPLPSSLADPGAWAALHHRLAGVSAGVEHDATLHAPRALELADWQSATEKSLVLVDSSRVAPDKAPVEDGNDRDANLLQVSLAEALERLNSALAAAEGALASLGATEGELPSGSDALVKSLRESVHWLVEAAQPAAATALSNAARLHRFADPAAATVEDATDERAVPERELRHPDALGLSTCPQCGASLGADDRTLDGSYCEACRTRWSE